MVTWCLESIYGKGVPLARRYQQSHVEGIIRNQIQSIVSYMSLQSGHPLLHWWLALASQNFLG